MAHPLVDADDALVADLLAGTLEIVREAGGFIAPTTRLVERHWQLSIESSAGDGSPMLRIPRECFVRVDRVTWAEQEGRMVIVEVPDDFGDLETEMLYLQVALHNACGKLEWMTATHPALDPSLPDDLVEAVQRLIPSFRNPMLAATDVLWANRCFRIAMSEDAAPERVLVPVVDLLNHHSNGAIGDWTGVDFEVATRRPFGTSEAALDYGMNRDALEMAVVYGFLHKHAHQSARDHYEEAALRCVVDTAQASPRIGSAQMLARAAQRALGHE